MSEAKRQPPEQQPPPVQRLRVRYAKRGRARFASHRDFSRAFERALRRAQVPMAYSSGFNPHPRISFANAAPTGAASEAEYLEIGLAQRVDPDWVRAGLDDALPLGLDVVAVVEATAGALAEALTASVWRIAVAGVPRDDLDAAVARLLAAEVFDVERMTKAGLRTFDVRQAVIALVVVDEATLELTSAHGTPLVRPDDVVQALGKLWPGFAPAQPPVLTRLSQGQWIGGAMVEPFAERPAS